MQLPLVCRCRNRSARSDLQRRDDEPSGGQFVGGAEILDDSAWRVRRVGTRAGVRGDLRRDFLSRGATHK